MHDASDAPRRSTLARKRFGQHFLTDPGILARIAGAIGIAPGDTVLEIGPGRGGLTEALLGRVGAGGRVVAVEIDRDLSAALRLRYAQQANLTLVEGDVLDVNLAEHVQPPFLLAGNIPYNITTPIIFKALDHPRASRMVFLVQREVAERLAASAGERAYGALSANVQAVARVEVLFRVAAGAFSPPPKVQSAVVRITPSETPVVAVEEEQPFRALVQSLFSFRRKQMIRALREATSLDAIAAARVLDAAHVRATDRPEVLSPAAFAAVLRAMKP